MKLKQIRHTRTSAVHIAIQIGTDWKRIEAPDQPLLTLLNRSEDDLLSTYPLHPYASHEFEEILPFQPTAYRDFMLYETHAINAARGFVKKYKPKLFPIVTLYERITGRVFPKLRPSPRYYQHPIYYLGNHLNFITNQHSISIPQYTHELDYELEIAAVINKPLKNATEQQAEDAICGFVILNDFSARDIQIDEINSGFGPMKSKNFTNSISTTVISKNELLPLIDNLSARVLINNTLIAEGTSSGKRYSFQQAIAYASWEEQLHPGELFGSGTIPNCTGIENGQMLKTGDTITLEVDHIGSLSNTVQGNGLAAREPMTTGQP